MAYIHDDEIIHYINNKFSIIKKKISFFDRNNPGQRRVDKVTKRKTERRSQLLRSHTCVFYIRKEQT